MRFGKRIALPSTAQIKHELRMMIAIDAIIIASGNSSMTAAQIVDLARFQTRQPREPCSSPSIWEKAVSEGKDEVEG